MAVVATSIVWAIAAVVGWAWIRARHVRALNRGLHELRRPAQSLSLILTEAEPDRRAGLACIDQLAAGLAALDREANGGWAAPAEETTAEEIAEGARRRWGWSGRVEVEARGAGPVRVGPESTGPVIDNLVANCLEHGSGPVRVEASCSEGELALTVTDRGSADRAGGGAGSGPGESDERHRRRDPRRGHGLELVARTVRERGGRLERGADGVVGTAVIPTEDGR